MLEFKNVSVKLKKNIFSNKKNVILNNISFHLQKKETLGIFGESGSGKTSIANVIFNFLPISNGSVLLKGKNLSKNDSRLELANIVQVISQNPQSSFDPDMFISKAFEEIMRTHHISKNKGEIILSNILSDVNMQNVHLERLPNTFSGGELQRLSIARALLIKPEILILDEFDSMLDVDVKIKLYDVIKKIKWKHHLSCICISHDIRTIFYLSDQVMMLEKGQIIEKGSKKILKTSNNPFLKEIRKILLEEIF